MILDVDATREGTAQSARTHRYSYRQSRVRSKEWRFAAHDGRESTHHGRPETQESRETRCGALPGDLLSGGRPGGWGLKPPGRTWIERADPRGVPSAYDFLLMVCPMEPNRSDQRRGGAGNLTAPPARGGGGIGAIARRRTRLCRRRSSMARSAIWGRAT